jgi:RNA polymerase sigma-70 factor (ECF subfamily)
MAVSPGVTRDHAAFEELYRLHARSVYGFVHSRLGNPDDAEDVTQSTFLNAYRSCMQGRYPRHPESWLIAIARNECRQRFRQKQRRPREERLEEGTVAVQDPGSEWTAEDIHRALNSLPELSRRALMMRELEGRAYAEIARELELSDSALQSLLFRARRQLREQFEETLTCADARRLLGLRREGELGIAGRRALRTHLRACPACAERERRPGNRGLALPLVLITLPVRRALQLLGLSGGSTGAGSAVAGKAAAVLVAGALTGGAVQVIERSEQPVRTSPSGMPTRVAVRPAHYASTGHSHSAARWAPAAGRLLATPPPATGRHVPSSPSSKPEAGSAPPPSGTVEPVRPDPGPEATPPPSGSVTPVDPQPEAAADVPSDAASSDAGVQVSPDPAPADTPHGRSGATHPTPGRPDGLPAATPPTHQPSGVSSSAEPPRSAAAEPRS